MFATGSTQQIGSSNEEHESSSQECEVKSEAFLESKTNKKGVCSFNPFAAGKRR